MSIITKKVTMTDKAWSILREGLYVVEHCLNTGYYGPEADVQIIDISDAITALSEAEIISVSETYALPDAWAKDAENEGA